MRLSARLVVASLAGAVALLAQTTQGLISGRILNSVTGRPVAGGSVAYSGTTLSANGTVRSDAQGYYFLPLLSAGTYIIRTTADSFQPQELQQLELPVAGRLNIDFRLRPLNDVWEAGQYRSVFLPGT
ncbi:MAG TPA: carboxypeptidase-like regulatory domain-containing protein, partial [Bryobacteraceae bacterium]|nr:carboxypeptidase-like regulatory domain-containing protein [Bryobacteraceae bacterium]